MTRTITGTFLLLVCLLSVLAQLAFGGAIHLAVHRHDSHAEVIGAHRGEFGNVVGNAARADIRLQVAMDGFEDGRVVERVIHGRTRAVAAERPPRSPRL